MERERGREKENGERERKWREIERKIEREGENDLFV